MTDDRSHYEVLGVSIDADFAEIKSAYRKLARIHHPDLGGDATTFAQINKAYDVLSDADARKRYDQTGKSDEPVRPEDVRARAILVELFSKYLDRPDPIGRYTFNLISAIKGDLREGLRIIEPMIKEVQEKIAALERLRGRLDGAPLLGILAQRIRMLEARIIFFENEKPAIERAVELLDECRHAPELDLTMSDRPGWKARI